MTPEQVVRHLRRANAVALRARGLGRHPFGAILVGPARPPVAWSPRKSRTWS